MLFTSEWRWFEDVFNRMGDLTIPRVPFSHVESEGKLTCELELPGVKKEDLTLEVGRGGLLISWKRKGEAFNQELRVSPRYDLENAKATLADGVLTLVFEPKQAPTEKKLLPVG